MLKFRNFGKKSLEEIVLKLKKYDLTLGMDVDSIYRRINDAKSRGIPHHSEQVAETVVAEAETPTTPPRKPVPSATSKKKVKHAT